MLSNQRVVPNTTARETVSGVPPHGIFMWEGGFTIKTLTEDCEKAQAYQLRHKVFAEELGWVPRSATFMEMDEYDKQSVFIGVLNKKRQLVAFSRLILPGSTFMIENEFSSLIGSWHGIRKLEDTAEVSRLCVSPEARNTSVHGNFGTHAVSMALYKGIYHLCNRNNVRYIYIVIEYKIYRLFLSKGFPCRLVGEPRTMADGCVAVAALVDFKELLRENSRKRPEMMRWFSRYQSDHSQSPLLPPESCSRSAVSA